MVELRWKFNELRVGGGEEIDWDDILKEIEEVEKA